MSALLLPVTVTVAVLFAGTGSTSGDETLALLTNVPIVVTVAFTVIAGIVPKLVENGPGRVHVIVTGPAAGTAGMPNRSIRCRSAST